MKCGEFARLVEPATATEEVMGIFMAESFLRAVRVRDKRMQFDRQVLFSLQPLSCSQS